jgi:DHA1 family bicyclomycin/chloramphenicol resistance-like MFS transporter
VVVQHLANERTGKATLVPGSRRFILTLAMCMAVTALAVDTALPAFPEIRESLGLAEGATEVTRLITYFLLGNSLGLLPAGLLADRFGRRPVMWGGLALYIAGAIGTMLAPSLTVMFIARFVWGLGSAGPRVSATAMVRDAYAGEQMARQMSFIMAVFILVPTFAPLLATGLLYVGPWQLVFGVCAALAGCVAVAVTRLPETLPVDDRRPLAAADVWEGCRIVLATPGTIGYVVSLTALYGVFISYLASSEVVLDQVFDLSDWFPIFFGGTALVMGFAMFINGRIVERIGLDRLIRFVFTGSSVCVTLLLTLALATDGEPPFWLFVVVLSMVLFGHQMLIPNLNAAAMRPLAHVAGTGAAILGMVPGVLGAVIGGVIDDQFDGTVTPLAIGFVVCTAVAIVAWTFTARESRTSDPAARPAAPTAHRPAP